MTTGASEMGTIGDEKVVAEQVPPVVGYLADTWPAYRFTADSHPPATYPVVRLSDYASLLEEKNQVAADRDLWRSMATFEGKVSASVLDDLHTTQAQLAELRGKVGEVETLMRKDIAEFGGCLKLVNRLRTLATADGGG